MVLEAIKINYNLNQKLSVGHEFRKELSKSQDTPKGYNESYKQLQ